MYLLPANDAYRLVRFKMAIGVHGHLPFRVRPLR